MPAHGNHPAAIDALRRRSVVHGAASDYDAAVQLHDRHPCLSRSCVGHLLPEGMLLLLENRCVAHHLVASSLTACPSIPIGNLGFSSPLIRFCSTPARFASVFSAKFGVSTPEWRWSPSMRAALLNTCAEFVSGNTRTLQLPLSQTPAATPGPGTPCSSFPPPPHVPLRSRSGP